MLRTCVGCVFGTVWENVEHMSVVSETLETCLNRVLYSPENVLNMCSTFVAYESFSTHFPLQHVLGISQPYSCDGHLHYNNNKLYKRDGSLIRPHIC